jgi:hypothetical protein
VQRKATITIDKEVLDELVRATGAASKSAAVMKIIDEYLRRRRVEKILAMKGKLKFDMTADGIRHCQR